MLRAGPTPAGANVFVVLVGGQLNVQWRGCNGCGTDAAGGPAVGPAVQAVWDPEALKEAVGRLVEHFVGTRLARDAEVVFFMHRHQIEGRSPEAIGADLKAAFDRCCGAKV